MDHILSLISGAKVDDPKLMTVEEYVKETVYIAKFLSPIIKATNLATYNAMFYLSFGKTGQGKISLPWTKIGELCGNERETGTVNKNEAVRNRTHTLQKLGCIEVHRARTGANTFVVIQPSKVETVAEEIRLESDFVEMLTEKVPSDYYNDQTRRAEILRRDRYHCVYCLKKVDQDSFFLDHFIPRAAGGGNGRTNLLTSCDSCNSRKSDGDGWGFLRENYRSGLLSQLDYAKQKTYIEEVLNF